MERFGQTVNRPGLAARLQLKAIAVTQAKCSQCQENQPELVQQLMAKSLVAQGGHQAHNQLQTAFRPDTSPISLPHLNQTKDRQIHQEKEALQAAPMLDPNGQECQDLLKKIRNIIQDIKKREGELHDNPNNLPEATPNDHINPRESKRGHRRLINQLKQKLAERKADYVRKCGQLPDDVRQSEDPNVNWFQWPNIQLPNPGEWIPPIPIPANPFRFAN
ncbi:MAG TPA: hypothetical protein DCE56_44640 [Cyanobacteria bacterium UBA8553]|nr:hypothetical protein [Cyanobacteria bacterium UBA8553]